jgi:serine/threonine-protein kinase
MLASAPESREELTSGTSYSPPPAFGRFKLLHQIGAGVLGPVFRTHDPEQDRLVAVKALTLDLTPEQATALGVEFERLAGLGLDAPCAAAPIGAGVEEFVPFVAVPYVSGESLDAAVRQYGPAPAGDAIRLIAHVAEALDAAALAGVHHGSLHPRDIIVTPGETHVTGLGIAEALERVGLRGPVRRPYVAPERESGDEWGAAADIYSLAAIAYEVLTGRRAMPGTDQPLPGLNDLRVHDAAALRDVIETALDPDASRRPSRARDFAAGFAAALSESAGGAAGERAQDRRARKPRTRPPKLPGLDEPLAAPDAALKGRVRPVAPVPMPPAVPAAEPSPIEAAPPEPAVEIVGAASRAVSEVRYVPVIDPTDTGDTGGGRPSQSVPAADVAGEPGTSRAEPAAVQAPPESPAPPSAQAEAPSAPPPPIAPARPAPPVLELADRPTPDLRLADVLPSRADTSGETIDTALAAALDRLVQEPGPMSSALGPSLPGPGAANLGELLSGDAGGLEPAAEAPLPGRFSESPESPGSAAPPAEKPPRETGGTILGLDLGALDLSAGSRALQSGATPDLRGVDALLPAGLPVAPTPIRTPTPGPSAEPERPFVRGRGAERRRPTPRFGRFDSLPPSIGGPGGQNTGVPRAFDEGKPAPQPRPTPEFDLLTRPESSGRPVVPVIVGIVCGLIIGLAGGYWLGSRNTVPAAAPAQATVSRVPAAAPPASAPSTPPPGTSPAGEPVSAPGGGPPPQAAAGAPSVPAVSSPPPPAAVSATQTAPVVNGSIRVTASEQANVFLDGARQGMTPRTLRDLPMGRHTIRVTRPGYAPQEQAVALTAEEPAAVADFTLRRSDAAPSQSATQAPAVKSVLIVLIESAPPGARIRIDGRDLAPTPLTVRQLRPGTHTIELRLPGYKTWTQRLTVAAGDNRRIMATLERDTPR